MINIRNLSKSYGEKNIFSDLNGTVDDGFCLLVGKSGCGKSTLLKIIAGLEKADGGTVDGVCGNVTVMFQELRLFPSLTALQNLTAVAGNDKRDEALLLVKKLGLSADDAEKKPDQLSGGMNQRVALCRAILFDKYSGGNTVILDEPFSKLDTETKNTCIDAVHEYFYGKNVIIITHNAEECAALSASVIYFDDLISKK